MPHSGPTRVPEDLLVEADSHRHDIAVPYQVRLHPIVRLTLWVGGVALVLYFFDAFTLVALPLLGAAALAAALAPLTRRMPGPPWARILLTGVSTVVALAAVASLTVWALWSPIRAQMQRWPQTRQQLDAFLSSWTQRLGFEETLTVDQVRDQLLAGLTGGRATDLLQNTVSGLGITLVALALLGFGALYLLGGSARSLQHGLERLLPGREAAIRSAGSDLEHRLRWWLIGTLVSMLVSGTLQGVGYWLVGLEFALAIGVIGGLAELVPTFGPAAVFLLALLIAATQGTTQIIGVFVVYAIVQTLESYVIVPLVMKRAVHISPLITLFTVILWGQVFGLPGLLLAIPINLVIWTLIEQFYLERSGAVAERAPPA